MSKPDKPGEWHSRDERRIVVYAHTDGELAYREIRQFPPLDGGWNRVDKHLEGDDWLPAEPPKFPRLPPKLPRCLFTSRKFVWPEPHWGMIKDGRIYAVGCSPYSGGYDLHDIKPVYHPDNDPEAVRLIEEAKRK